MAALFSPGAPQAAEVDPPSIPPSSEEVRLHPKSKPTRKRLLDDLEDWDNHESYMHVKQLKLRNQFDGMGIDKKSSIFNGVSIYVNGWTQPRAEELKEMVYAHGGRYEYNMYPNSVITHTIASNLPNSKILKLGSSVVCKPSWIVDSIAANRLLPVDDYLLYRPKGGQRRLGFTKAGKKEGETEIGGEVEQHGADIEADHFENGEFSSDIGETSEASAPQPLESRSSKKAGAEFVNEFFTHSRLHYLSTWSTELKQFTADMLKKKITPKLPKLPYSASLSGLKTRAVVHIDLDCFFVSVSLRSRPHLRGKPVAVTHAKLPQASSEPEAERGDITDGDAAQPFKWTPQDSTSDIASCSYEARAVGISNGMPVGEAMKKCPDLILLPYDFNSYREVSQIFYETLFQYSSLIEAVSCDEAYVELTEHCRDYDHVSEVVRELRNEVQQKTGCTVSAGIAHNMLLARMCTRVAKPDGQFHLPAKETTAFLDSQRVRDLPGVGYSMAGKLGEMGIKNCAELRSLSLDALQAQFGAKTGKMLHEYARGLDGRKLRVMTERKSVSVDINFGIRFQTVSDAETLLRSLAAELEKRAKQADVMGNQLTLKMKIRKQNAPKEPRKFLGHGACDNVSRSLALLQPSRDASECGALGVRILKQLSPVVADIRGMGLQLGKLVPVGTSGGQESSSSGGARSAGADLKKFLLQGSAKSSPLESQAVPDSNHRKPLSLRRKKIISPAKLPGKSPRKSPRVSPGKRRFAGKTLKAPPRSLKHYFAGQSIPEEVNSNSKREGTLEDSFRIDLPPASQLDRSVLEALPPHMREKVLQGYASRGLHMGEKAMVTTEKEDCAGNVAVDPTATEDKRISEKCTEQATTDSGSEKIIVGDQKQYLSAWKEYISGWCDSFPEGPTDCDTSKVSDYLCRLAGTNLEVTELCLKRFRRLIEMRDSSSDLSWNISFNTVLHRVQQKVRERCSGHLRIKAFNCVVL